MTAALTCRGIAKLYGSVRALGPLDLEVPAGSVFGLLGPNGAGKTTLLSMAVGLRKPSAGTIDAGPPQRIGFLDQDPRYYSWMTGGELLRFSGRLYGLNGARLVDAIGRATRVAGLEEFINRRIGGYSGGMRQRLGVAQAILHEPPLILLDEPVSSLDPEGRRDVLEVIEGLRGSATVVLSTHILADVERVCDHVAILDHGELLVVSTLEDLLERYATPVYEISLERRDAAAAPTVLARLRDLAGVAGVELTGPNLVVRTDGREAAGRELIGALAQAGVSVERLQKRRPSLEEVFLAVIERRRQEAAA